MATPPASVSVFVEQPGHAIHVELASTSSVAPRIIVRPSITCAYAEDGNLILLAHGNVQEVFAKGVWVRYWKAATSDETCIA